MTFPRLRTGAIAQYPLVSSIDFSTTVLHHVDGSEQRFPQFRGKVQRWEISLERLTEDELTQLREVFDNAQVSGLPFSFVDEWNVEHPECVFEQSDFATTVNGEQQHSTKLVIRKKG